MTDLEKKACILIRRKSAVSRAELARKLCVSRPTASVIVENLLAAGLIRECGKGPSNGGTMPTLLSPREDAAFLAGIDFGYCDRMSAVLVDWAGNIVEKAETEFDPDNEAGMIAAAADLLEQLSPGRCVRGAAIALSAVVDEKSRRVLKSINRIFGKGEFPANLSQVLGIPVFVANRSRAAAVAEAFGGAAEGQDDFALISLGKSIGASFWCAGKLFCGASSAAGEIRNLRLADGESFESAIARAGINREKIAEICGTALNQIVEIMDLPLFVLAGRFADFGADFAEILEKKLAEHGKIKVRQADFGRFSAARGSAFLMGENLIDKL